MELWFSEKHAPDLAISVGVKRTLYRGKSRFQDIAVLDTDIYGRILTLDGVIQTTERDEFVYHEMIVHPALIAHPNPRQVLVIGGGDGGTVREVLKHDYVERVVLAEIDAQVVEVAKEYLPTISCALDDERCDIQIGDGIEYVKRARDCFDVIIVDSTDPVGPAVGLFSEEFYRAVYKALTADGFLVAQTESPFMQRDFIRKVYRTVAGVYPIAKLLLASVPTYPCGLWSFTVGSKKYDPARISDERRIPSGLRYYTGDVHAAAFTLPPFVAALENGQ